MRLGVVSFAKHCKMWHRGKYRRPWKITLPSLMKVRYDLAREEQNMLLLRHPYLTVEQSKGHMEGLKTSPHEIVGKFMQLREIKFTKYVTLEDRLNHLKVGETWD